MGRSHFLRGYAENQARCASAPGIEKIQRFLGPRGIRFFEQPSDSFAHHIVGIVQQQAANVKDGFGLAAAFGFLDKRDGSRATFPTIVGFGPRREPVG